MSSKSASCSPDAPARPTAPEVTVLMGVYNGVAHIKQAMRSVLDQTFTNFELLIIDDGSSDRSVEAIEKTAQYDARIRLLRSNANQGLGYALSRGMQEARGQLVARMDADDISVPERLRKQVDYLLAHPDTDVVGSFALDIDEQGQPLRERRVPTSHQRIVELIWTCPLIHPTVMFRRQAVIDAGSYSATVRRRQDYELWFRCVHAGLRFANIPEPLVHYRHSEQTIRRNNLRAMLAQARVGINGCRLIGAPPSAYLGVTLPVLDAMLPARLRAKLMHVRRRLDPRHGG